MKVISTDVYKKAYDLNERIFTLSKLVIQLRPEFCMGIGFSKKGGQIGVVNKQYHCHLWGTTPDSEEDEAIIMREGIRAMYHKAYGLLQQAQIDLDAIMK